MKKIKCILLLLTTICSCNLVFEFSDTEKKVNFENETHSYIHQDNQTHSITFVKTFKQLDDAIISWLPEINYPVISANEVRLSQYKYISPPPERCYILYASLLI